MLSLNQVNMEAKVKILSQFLATQSIFHVFPTAEIMGEFIIKDLETVPGIESYALCFSGLSEPLGNMKEKECGSCEVLRNCFEDASIIDCNLAGRDGICVLPLETSERLYGFLQISVENIEKLSFYKPFLKNISNLVAINMENQWQKKRMEESNRDLEECRDYLKKIVEKRTSELTETNKQVNQVIAESKLKEVELKKYQNGLETLVEEHTVSLIQTNKELKCEILERKRVEEALERQKEELEIIFNSVPAMIFYIKTERINSFE